MLGRIERGLSKKMVETIGPPTSSVGIVLHEGPLSYRLYKRPDDLPISHPPYYQSILLIQRGDNKSIALVAGGVENETPKEAIIREGTEEIGLPLNPDKLNTLAHFPKISRDGLIQDRIVYSHELNHGTLSGLGTNWRYGMAPVVINDPKIGGRLDISYYYSNPRYQNDEVKRLILLRPISLFFFREMRRFGGKFEFIFYEGKKRTGDSEWSGATQLFKGKIIESLSDIIK